MTKQLLVTPSDPKAVAARLSFYASTSTYAPQSLLAEAAQIINALTAQAAKAPAVSEADVGRIPHADVDKIVTDLIRANYSDKPRLALAIGRSIVKANERGIQSADDARSGTVLLLKQVMQTRAVDYVEAQFPGWHNRASATLSRETKPAPSDPPSQEASAPEAVAKCPHCENGYRGSDVECVNGVLIDIDEYHEGWQTDVLYPPAPCHPLFCKTCSGSGRCPDDVPSDSDDCPNCMGTGYIGGNDDCQERLEARSQP